MFRKSYQPCHKGGKRKIQLNRGTQLRKQMVTLQKTRMPTIQSSEQQSKSDKKCLQLILQHFLTFQNPVGSSGNDGSSSRVVAFDHKKRLNLKRKEEIPGEMMSGMLVGIKANGVAGRRATKTYGANHGRSSAYLRRIGHQKIAIFQ